MSLAKIFKKTRGRQTYVSDSRWVMPTSFIGLEAEYEGVKDRNLPPHTFADFWQYHEEGSLKDFGAEYVFSTPLFGIDAYNATQWLVSHAKTSGWKCTKRTGIHVHLDVRDLSIPQLAGLCIVYGAIEAILYRWVGDGRSSSHFCIPLYVADEALLSVCTILKAAFQDEREEDGELALNASEAFQRYAGFNLQALFKFGSIEFRHLNTTHDLDRIVDWINIVMSLKAVAFKLPQSDGAVVRMLERMSIQELLEYIFGSELSKKLYTEHSQEEFEKIGLLSARDIAVHGCGNTDWVPSSFPKGEHAGFVKWIKGNKEIKKGGDHYPDSEVQEIEIEAADWDDPPPEPMEEVPPPIVQAAEQGFVAPPFPGVMAGGLNPEMRREDLRRQEQILRAANRVVHANRVMNARLAMPLAPRPRR